jgi:hypothetical protein
MDVQLLKRTDRRIFFGIAILATLIAGLLLLGSGRGGTSELPKPQLLLMSSIALQWGETNISEIAKGEAKASPLFTKLSNTNKLVPIDDFQKLGKPGSSPLLLIQPRALAPRELVELDGWVRRGGSAIIFADPALDWPSDLPLGDQRRPLFTSLLTPMFQHWGLELALPVSDSDEDAETDALVGRFRLAPKSAGIWLPANNQPTAECKIREDQFIAYCKVGKGRALLIADADLLEPDRWTDGLVTSGTMRWLDDIIAASRAGESLSPKLWENQGK